MIPLHWMLGIGSLSQLIRRPCVMSIDAAAVLPRADSEPPRGAGQCRPVTVGHVPP